MSKLEEEFGKFDGFEYKERNRKPLNTLVYGCGINNSPFVVQPKINGLHLVRHPAYTTWISMLNRSYSKVYKEKNPTYLEVTCCEEWLLFTNFAKWFKENYIVGYQLDKDLLVKGNKNYGPDTCIFIPKYINSFITLRSNDRGNFPLGVTFESKNRFKASIGTDKKYLGLFINKEEAHRAWQKAKLEQAIAFNFPPLQRVIDQLKFDIENNLETISL